jgi:hypothetical protein
MCQLKCVPCQRSPAHGLSGRAHQLPALSPQKYQAQSAYCQLARATVSPTGTPSATRPESRDVISCSSRPSVPMWFGRSQIRPVRSGLDSDSGYASRVRSQANCPVFLQEFLDDALDVAIIAFTKVVVPNPAFRVDEILGGPILVIK